MFFLKIILPFFVFSLAVIAGDQQELPEDVFSFVEKRDGCDHFRGEDPYDEERRKFILKNLQELCTGTDVELAKLKTKYESNSIVLSRLSNYDEDIEPNK
jgi:hypothetical protein